MLDRLKNLNLVAIDLDEAIYLYSLAHDLKATYATFEIDTPEWLERAFRELDREIVDRRRDALEARLGRVEARIEANKPLKQKRREDEALAESLRERLGV